MEQATEQDGLKRDALALALMAVQEFDALVADNRAAKLDTEEMIFQRAQLRTLWAIAAELRSLRFAMEGDDE